MIFWGGLRDSVPVALALGVLASLTGSIELVAMVFGGVLFSLLGQGLTIPSLLHAFSCDNPPFIHSRGRRV